jgi:hypothetical protein
MVEWMAALEKATTKEPHPPPKKTGKIGLKNRMERNVIGHAATSPLGNHSISSKKNQINK